VNDLMPYPKPEPEYSGGNFGREKPPDTMAPVLKWDDFLTYAFDWKQSQHVAMIGPTDSGKSTLTYNLLPLRKYHVFFATKPKDKVLEVFGKKGKFTRLDDWPPLVGHLRKRPATAEEMPKRLLWPSAEHISSVNRQAQVFRRAFQDVYNQGGWTVTWDEYWYMNQVLKLEDEGRIFLQQARSNDISFVMGAQRPARIPLEIYDQSTHLFFWRDADERNLKTMGGIGWLNAGPIRAFVARLEPHQVLYINARTGHMYRTTCPEAD
jgi:hypothetical protein